MIKPLLKIRQYVGGSLAATASTVIAPASGRRLLSWRILAATVGVLVVGLAATGLAVAGAEKEVRHESRARFDHLTDRLIGETQRSVNQPVYGLKGARGLYLASSVVPRQLFADYVASRDLPREFPGAIGFGVVQRVMRQNVDAFEAAQRQDGAPDFTVWDNSDPGSNQPLAADLYVIQHCFPQERNHKAWGFDIGSESVRRTAVETAVSTGLPTISGKVELVQDNVRRAAFLYFVPVFQRGSSPSTPQERQNALVAVLYTPIILAEAVARVVDAADGLLDFEVFDGESPSKETQLFDFDGHLDGVTGKIDQSQFVGRMFETSTSLAVGGRTWTLISSTTPKFEATVDHTTPIMIGIGGGLFSLLAAGFVFLSLTAQGRALSMARAMTADLAAANASAQDALRETAALRETLDIHAIISVADSKGRIIDINSNFCLISGYDADELLGQDHRILNSGVHPRSFWVEVWRSLAAGKPWHGDVCNRAKDGSLYWVDTIIAPFMNSDGKIEKYVSVRHDITSRRRSEAELLAITQRFELAAHASGVGIWDYDISHDRITWDDQMFRLYGITRETFSGVYEAWRAGVHPDDQPRCDAEIQAAIRGEKEFDTEFRVVWPDGSIHSIRAISTLRRDATGRPVHMIGTNWDVTAQRETAAHLRSLTDSLEEAQSVARTGNWSFDLPTGKVIWSKQLFSLYERNETDGPPDYAGVMADYDAESAKLLDEAVKRAATDGTPYSLVLRTSKSASGARYVRGEGRARRDNTGKIVGLFGISTDITAEVENAEALRQARTQAEAANLAKSAFLANMSHEIRTPLTAILGFADLLGDETSITPEQRIKAIETIRGAGTHLLTVINDILDLSKIEAEKMTVEKIDTPLTSVLREVESLMRPRAVGKGIALSAVLTTPIPDRILSDPTRLRQILMNLAGNAVKFTEAGGVTIAAGVSESAEQAMLVIEVDDTGPGMTPEQATNLFKAFGQADETVTRKHGGSGLGLTICRRLARLMGGEVVLARTESGKGSCFRLKLPLESVPGAQITNRLDAIANTQATVSTAVSLKGRILLAEDGPDNQRLISFHLSKAGASVAVADNGRIALEMLDNAAAEGKPFDLLLTDMHMPEMDGYTLASTLRKRGNPIAIVALTAHAMAEDRVKCLDSGCDDYATKPIDKLSLLSTCAKWMGESGSAKLSSRAA